MAPLPFIECQFGSCSEELREHVPDLVQVLVECLAPHEDIVNINEVSMGRSITHRFVEKDVELCWGV